MTGTLTASGLLDNKPSLQLMEISFAPLVSVNYFFFYVHMRKYFNYAHLSINSSVMKMPSPPESTQETGLFPLHPIWHLIQS